jgi:hypothetical protein
MANIRTIPAKMHKMGNQNLARDNKSLMYLLMEQDEFRAIVLGTAYIEITLTSILEKVLVNASALDLARLNFIAKVCQCEAIGAISDGTWEILKAIGIVRNFYAHSIKYVLTKTDIDSLQSHVANTPFKAFIADLAETMIDSAAKDAQVPYELTKYHGYIRSSILVMHVVLVARLEEIERGQFVRPREWPAQNLQDMLNLALTTEYLASGLNVLNPLDLKKPEETDEHLT